ncbi:hypothetical protein BGZ68_006834 [Mortierella alpina]|nr:hypothetical protein BGZ68_006834 [Mortierella alpina]
MKHHGALKRTRIVVVFFVLQTFVAAVLGAVSVLSLPPSHLSICPNGYLFEFLGEPGGAVAAQQMAAFKRKILGMKSVRIRHEFGMLLNGISIQVEDQDELRDLMAMQDLSAVTPLHPALGGCFGKGCKVAYGWDFVGDLYTGKNAPVPGSDPLDCAGHGTHVAGIIGASDDVVLGVAPKVTLGAYRVLGCSGSSNDDVILAALERAVVDGMDVINLSIGEPNGWPYNPVSRAITQLRSHGVSVAVSHGNENTQGLFSANYVGEGPTVLGVASFINTRVLLSYFSTSLTPDERILYAKSDAVPGLNKALSLVAHINGTDLGQGCEPFKEDLSGKVLLVLRGSCFFAIKAQNALDKGAAGILFVNNIPGSLSASIESVHIASGSLSLSEGTKLFKSLLSSTKSAKTSGLTDDVLTTFSATPAAFVNPAGGSSSLFSSYGLDNELHIKPDLGAPGENIYSTWLVKNGSYMTLSGTSMASPHVAGALALALEHTRKITGGRGRFKWPQIERIYRAFKNTAEPAYVFQNHDPFDMLATATVPTAADDLVPGEPAPVERGAMIDSVAKQGSGMINIFRALTSLKYGMRTGSSVSATEELGGPVAPITMTLVTPPSLELNDTEFGTTGSPQMITISNNGPSGVLYKLSHLPAESIHEFTIESKQVKTQNMNMYNVTKPTEKDKDAVMFSKARARVQIPPDNIYVAAGESRRVALTILPPEDVPVEQHWIYSGYIIVRAVSSESSDSTEPDADVIHVPYAGVTGRMKSLPIFLRPTEKEVEANNQTALCQVLGGMANKTDFVYSLQGKDVPILSFCIANPTRFLILDLIGGLEAAEGLTETQDMDGSALEGSYEVIGRVASNDYVPRSLVDAVVTAVQWDGTLDHSEGQGPEGAQKVDVKGSREIIHREPGMDLIYGMRAKTENGGEASRTTVDDRELGHGTQMVQRDLSADDYQEEFETETTRVKVGNSPVTEREKSRNQHLLKDAHKKGPGSEKMMAPDGRYRLRLRALRIMGDIDDPADYDVWITPTFTIKRKKGAVTNEATMPKTEDSGVLMVLTRQRHTRSTALSARSATVPSKTHLAQPRSALQSRTRTRVKASSTNPGTSENGGQAGDPLSTENNQHSSCSPGESDTQLSVLLRASPKQAPLTARGTRRNASAATRRSESIKASANPPAFDSELDKDAVEDVEEPRRQRVEAVEIVQRAFRAKKAMKDQQVEGNTGKEASPNSCTQISSDPTTAETLSMDNHGTTSALSTDANATHTDDTEELSLSQMSLSPPPTVSFEYEEEDYGSPWLMVYDSNPSASRYRRRTLQANWTIEDLERELQEDNPYPDPNPDSEDDSRLDFAWDGWRVSQSPITSRFSALSPSRRKSGASRTEHDFFSPEHSVERDTVYQPREPLTALDMDMDAGQEEGDDDPFGFAKVERQLQRTKSMRPKPVAINNWHRNDWEWDIIHTSNPDDDGDRQSRTPDDDTGDFNVTIESSPRKVPEAGMPASYNYPSAGPAKARSRARRIMRTEYLESILPRPRKRGASNNRRPVTTDSWTVSTRNAQESERGNEELSSSSEEEVLVRRRHGKATIAEPSVAIKQRQEKTQTRAQKRALPTTNSTKAKDKRAIKDKEAEKTIEEESSGWTAEQLAAHKERIRYFQQVDDFEMDVETVR